MTDWTERSSFMQNNNRNDATRPVVCKDPLLIFNSKTWYKFPTLLLHSQQQQYICSYFFFLDRIRKLPTVFTLSLTWGHLEPMTHQNCPIINDPKSLLDIQNQWVYHSDEMVLTKMVYVFLDVISKLVENFWHNKKWGSKIFENKCHSNIILHNQNTLVDVVSLVYEAPDLRMRSKLAIGQWENAHKLNVRMKNQRKNAWTIQQIQSMWTWATTLFNCKDEVCWYSRALKIETSF